MELLLSAKGISKSFQGRKVLDDIDIEIKKSEIIAISGASGAGKTTILNILNTLDKPDENTNSSLIIDGENIILYDDLQDCANKIAYYNNNPMERNEIAWNGYQKVLNNHTQKQRVDLIIQQWKNYQYQ